MTQQHPITPPPTELVQQWEEDWHHSKVRHIELEPYIAAQAAQWGADQELEACVKWLNSYMPGNEGDRLLRTSRRPKPLSLKEEALDALTLLCKGPDATAFVTCRDTIRRALEQLPDHE